MLRSATGALWALAQQAGAGALANAAAPGAAAALGGATALQSKRAFNFVPYVIESTSRGTCRLPPSSRRFPLPLSRPPAASNAPRNARTTRAPLASLLRHSLHRPAGERAFDIYSRLLRERIICVNGPIDDSTSNVIIAQLLYLESQHPEKPVGSWRPPPTAAHSAQRAICSTHSSHSTLWHHVQLRLL